MYHDLQAYKELNDTEKMIFRHLYEKLLFSETITLSDRQLSNFYMVSLSVWEKTLKKFCDSELLERNNIKMRENGKWKTVARQIKLSPKTFSFTSLRDFKEKFKKAEEMLKHLGTANGLIDIQPKDN